MGKSVNTIMVMGILTTIFLLLLSLFTLNSSPKVQGIIDMAQQIKWDTNVNSVSVNRKLLNNKNKEQNTNKDKDNSKYKYTIKLVSFHTQKIDVDERIKAIGEYVWIKFAKEKNIEKLHIIYEIKSGQGCYQKNIMRIEKDIEKPKEINTILGK